jgi:AraC family transcriptional regulator of adaptative response/methylated-DNA-[protein]-cysteine methyltransferase
VDILNETRWHAVETRDASAAGVFVYAVSSTGIYCRPGCSSRRPLRRNVEYFATPSDATEAGYRACRRCRPDEDHVKDPALASVVALCRRLEDSDTAVDVGEFAEQCGYSERHLRRRFTEVVGVSVASYARAQQAERVRKALRSKVPVTQAIYEAGYGSSRAFYEHGAPRLGMAPGTYRAGGRGERIGFTSLSTPIGLIVVASTARGVCAVRIGSDEAALEKELAGEFPNAVLERDDEGLAGVVKVLAGAVRGEAEAASLPLDLEGTAFQMRVWEALRAVPSGTTLTYSQVASRIGAPRAVRAVGSACGANPAALVVPCHRIVRRDGSLGGYRWGLEVKEALLEAEGARPGP